MSKVLVVDDEPGIRLTFAEFLKRGGYETLTAAGYEEANAIITNDRIEVAVIDINLPHRSGVELLQQLRSYEHYIPVIMITGEPVLSHLPHILRAGAYDFIAKPVVKDVLLSAVSRAVEKKRLIDDKHGLERQIKQHAEELEICVAERTADLYSAINYLNTVLDSSTEYAIIVVDTDGRIKLFNRGAELMLGYTADEALGRSPTDLFIDRLTNDLSLRKCAREAELKGRCQTEVVLRRADGEEFVASVALTPVRKPKDQALLGYLHIIKDLTAERLGEERLRQMQARLAHTEIVAALGRGAAQVAHEVKNPLTGLILYLGHLKTKALGRLGDSEMALIDKILHTINRLTNTTDQILNFARPVNLTLCRLDLNVLVHDALQLLAPQITANKVEVHLDLAEGEVSGRLDEGLLHSVLINIILNAIQAMLEGGKLSVSTSGGNGKLYLTVTDTGRGMSEEQLNSVFEPFVTTKCRGLGLGMPYVKKIINQHGGTIRLESRQREGTSVRIELPAEA